MGPEKVSRGREEGYLPSKTKSANKYAPCKLRTTSDHLHVKDLTVIWFGTILHYLFQLSWCKTWNWDKFCGNAIHLKVKHSFASACAANLVSLSSTTTSITSVLFTIDLCYASWNLSLLEPYEYNTTYWIQRGHHSHDFVFGWLVFLHIHCCRYIIVM